MSNLILRKSISHSLALQTIQAAQLMLCPYDLANKVCLKPLPKPLLGFIPIASKWLKTCMC